jgi:hypothetical protein
MESRREFLQIVRERSSAPPADTGGRRRALVAGARLGKERKREEKKERRELAKSAKSAKSAKRLFRASHRRAAAPVR